MSDDYLFDKTGKPDPTVERLEELLAQFGHDASTPAAPASGRPAAQPAHRGRLLAFVSALAAAAVLLFVVVLPEEHYVVHGHGTVATLSVGDTLTTSEAEFAELQIAKLGAVVLKPGSVLAVRGIEKTRHHLSLERGSLHATIDAPARVFQVSTPAGEAVDLGCEYTLDVDPGGKSVLAVREGRVAFEFDGRSVYVPAGASCVSLVGRGPGAPVFADAPPEFRKRLEVLEFDPAPDEVAVRALCDLVTRREDCLTLFHLLDAVSAELREGALDRLQALVPMPPGVTREGLLAGEDAMRLAFRAVMESAWRTEPGYND